MSEFNSSHFSYLPKRASLRSFIEDQWNIKAKTISLFPYSSASPTFNIEMENGIRVVIRGEPQNSAPFYPVQSCTLDKEIFVHRKVISLGLNAPELFLNGNQFTIPGIYPDGSEGPDFCFFVMGYVQGIAVDKKFHKINLAEKSHLIDCIAKVYSTLHKDRQLSFGYIDGRGSLINPSENLNDFLKYLFGVKRDFLYKIKKPDLAKAVNSLIKNDVNETTDLLEENNYYSQPSLVLVDASHGNMLATDSSLNLIDFDLAGYFEPCMEFCTLIFTFKNNLLQSYKNTSLWDYFLESYKKYGGVLPGTKPLNKLIYIFMIDAMIHEYIHKKTHASIEKKSKVTQIKKIIDRFLLLQDPNIVTMINAL